MQSKMRPTIEGKIEELALRLSELVDNAKEYEKLLKETNKDIEQIKTQELAELMETEGFAIGSKITLSNGKVITVKEFFNASIPSETKINKEKDPCIHEQLIKKKEDCIAWLDKHGIGDIIKTKLTSSFGRGDRKKVKEVLVYLEKKEILCKNDESVHPATLKGALKEIMANGENVPFELFNIHSGTTVEIK